MALPVSGGPPVRVFVVDDARVYLDVARDLIDATPGFDWIGEASCGENAVEQVERLGPDLVLMDIRMPGIGGIEAARQIASRAIPTTVVLITADESAAIVADVPIVPKHKLNPATLRRLWRDHNARGLRHSPPRAAITGIYRV
jgi:CheY-like chemotaxis protein